MDAPERQARSGNSTKPQVGAAANATAAPVLNAVLSSNKGLAKVFNPSNTTVVFASPERLAQLNKAGGADRHLEFWHPGENGSPDLPRPAGTDGKSVLEIYDPMLRDPQRLKDAVYGDMLHGMSKDPYYSKLRQQFIDNYPPAIKKWNDAAIKSGKFNDEELNDMYIRGRLAKDQGDEWNDPKRYSAKQLQILDEMRRYLREGTEK